MRKVTYCVVKAYLLRLKRQAFTMHWISMCYDGGAKPRKERAATRGKAGGRGRQLIAPPGPHSSLNLGFPLIIFRGFYTPVYRYNQ